MPIAFAQRSHPVAAPCVVGMGFIGSEVAASLRQKGLEVVAIDPSKTPLFRVLGEAVGHTIAELHRAHGVRTIFEDSVTAFEGTGRVSSVVTKGGLRVPCDFVVVGIGIEPAVEMLEGSGIHVDNGVVVDEYCETNVSGIYAAGDIANHYHPVFESSHPSGALAERHQARRRCRAQHAGQARRHMTSSIGSGRTNTTRICSTRDFTRRGTSSSFAVVWTQVAFWHATSMRAGSMPQSRSTAGKTSAESCRSSRRGGR